MSETSVQFVQYTMSCDREVEYFPPDCQFLIFLVLFRVDKLQHLAPKQVKDKLVTLIETKQTSRSYR